MRCAIKETLLSVSLLCAFGLAAYAQAPAPAPVPTMTPRTVPNFVTITDQTMRAPKPRGPRGLDDVPRQLSGLGLQLA
jgi:hypothetical protein